MTSKIDFITTHANDYVKRDLNEQVYLFYANAPMYDSVTETLATLGLISLTLDEAGVVGYGVTDDEAWGMAYHRFIEGTLPTPSMWLTLLNGHTVVESVKFSRKVFELVADNEVKRRAYNIEGLLDDLSIVSVDGEKIMGVLSEQITALQREINETEENGLIWAVDIENREMWQAFATEVSEAQKALTIAQSNLKEYESSILTKSPFVEQRTALTQKRDALMLQVRQFLPT